MPADIARTAQRGTQGILSKNQTALQEAGELGTKALEDFPSKQGLFQTIAATSPIWGTAAGGVSGLSGALIAYPAIVAGGKLLTSEAFERLISGQSKALQTYARSLQRMGYGGRQLSVLLAQRKKQEEEKDAT